MNVYYMNGTPTGSTFPQSAQDYLLWHHFGYVSEERNRDLVDMYRRHFSGRHHNIRNLALFIDSYMKRTDLAIERNSNDSNFKCSVVLLCGSYSPHVDDVVNMNGRCNPNNVTWMKVSDCGMALEEQPSKVFEAFRLFLQGLGYALSTYDRRRSLRQVKGGDSDSETYEQMVDMSGHRVIGHIVENPIPAMLTNH